MPRDRIADAVLGGVTLRQILSAGYNENGTVVKAKKSGDYTPAEVVMIQSGPQVSLQSADIKGALDGINAVGGLLVSSGTVTIPFQQTAAGGLHGSGSVHNALSGTDALILIDELSVRKGDQDGATASLTVHGISSDGETDPFSPVTNQALGSQSYNKGYDLGPCSYDPDGAGVMAELTEIVGVRVVFGNQVTPKFYGGDDFPTDFDVEMVEPQIIIEAENYDNLQTIAKMVGTMDGVRAWFKQRSDGGRHVASASAAHIKCELADGLAVVGLNASGSSAASYELTLEGKTLTVASDAAIALT